MVSKICRSCGNPRAKAAKNESAIQAPAKQVAASPSVTSKPCYQDFAKLEVSPWLLQFQRTAFGSIQSFEKA